MTVRVPSGMTEADLARPLVEVRDFETNELEYEIYSYGEENVIVPVKEKRISPVERLAVNAILEEIRKYDRYAEASLAGDRAIVKVANEVMPRLIGKEGANIKALERKLGISIDVEPRTPTLGKEVQFEIKEAGSALIFTFHKNFIGKLANFYAADKFLFSATVGKKGQIRLAKDSDLGKSALVALAKRNLKAFV
jgi:ATPase